jgi:oligoribonuclease NrnB/cAMP/cGMP phosphodiesterase (DHH superfamily)
MIKLFSHADLDGIGCGILGILAFGDNVDISCCGHNNINAAVLNHFNANTKDEVHITDICVNSIVAKAIDKSGRKYQVLDHHATSLDMNKYRWCKVQVENEDGLMTSGTEMYYKWLIENGKLQRTETLDRFVEVVRNYDTWRWAEMGEDGLICKDVNDLLYLYGRDEFIEWALKEIRDEEFPYLYEEDIAVLEVNERTIDEYVDEKDRQMVVSSVCGVPCGIVFADKYFNDIGHALCDRHPEIDFVAMVDMGRCSVSYRAEKDGVDVGAIAKNFGGGGHQKAAGSEFSKDLREKIANSFFNFN